MLRGEMSLIGPRPERPEFVDQLASGHPVLPGAARGASPASPAGPRCASATAAPSTDARTKLEYDLYYVRHAGFYLDALIALKTVAVMLKLQGK